ncbi:MAG: Fic family protein [Streptococcaceae bacterium]|jgi:Fic family protein|nr:Fic family protein [Streptococcaceae bacterium]
MTITKKQFLQIAQESNILEQEYALDVLVRIAHHSSAIEGNTLSLSDTITIIVDELTPTRSKSMRELYEVANHREALADVLKKIKEATPPDTAFIKLIHKDLMDHIREDAGSFKTQQNAILGSMEKLATPGETPALIIQWLDNLNYQLENLTAENFLMALAERHIEFESIHPFSDGNGRTGRMLLMYATLKKLNTPLVITIDERAEYIEAIQQHSAETLANLFTRCLEREQSRKASFDYQEAMNSEIE